MDLCREGSKVRQAMAEAGPEAVRFRSDFEGTKAIIR
jgi:hypothetical protein